MNIVNYSGFKQTINTYISKHKRQKKNIWDAIYNRNVQIAEPHIELTTPEHVFLDHYRRFIILQYSSVLWELKYQQRMNDIIQTKFYDKIYIWRTIIVKINKRIFYDDICVNIIKFILY